jgi:hypothetical protein
MTDEQKRTRAGWVLRRVVVIQTVGGPETRYLYLTTAGAHLPEALRWVPLTGRPKLYHRQPDAEQSRRLLMRYGHYVEGEIEVITYEEALRAERG